MPSCEKTSHGIVVATMDEPDATESSTAASLAVPDNLAATKPADSTARDIAFAVFYREKLAPLVAFLRWQGVPLREATDVAQEAMIQAYRSWLTIDHPQAWIRRVASRMWARRIANGLEDPIGDATEIPSLLTVTDVEAWEHQYDVLQIIDRLPMRQRQVLAWTLDGFTPTEIATELEMSAEAVRASPARARRAVAMYLVETEACDDE